MAASGIVKQVLAVETRAHRITERVQAVVRASAVREWLEAQEGAALQPAVEHAARMAALGGVGGSILP